MKNRPAIARITAMAALACFLVSLPLVWEYVPYVIRPPAAYGVVKATATPKIFPGPDYIHSVALPSETKYLFCPPLDAKEEEAMEEERRKRLLEQEAEIAKVPGYQPFSGNTLGEVIAVLFLGFPESFGWMASAFLSESWAARFSIVISGFLILLPLPFLISFLSRSPVLLRVIRILIASFLGWHLVTLCRAFADFPPRNRESVTAFSLLSCFLHVAALFLIPVTRREM